MGALLRPPELLHPRLNQNLGRRVEPLAGERRPPSQAPGRPGSRRSGPDAGNPEMLEVALSQETARTVDGKEQLLPPEEGREENPMFLFVSVSSLSAITHLASSQESAVRGCSISLRTSGQSRLGPREFGNSAEHAAFCTIQLYSPSLHHHRYVNCAVGAACTASGGVARAAQPISLAHVHNLTQLRDSLPVDRPSSMAFSRLCWQSGMPLFCTRRLLSSWQRMQSSWSLQLR